jgi:hypothetical protein
MQTRFGEHPTEDSLERYLLRHSSAKELEQLETHILGCPECVARLERAESYITCMQAACREVVAEAEAEESPSNIMSWFDRATGWLTPLRLSWTAAVAVLVAGLIVAPAQFALRSPVSPAHVNLAAWRGAESVSVPAKRPLNVRLNSIDLPDGAVGVQLVDSQGKEVSHGSASINQESTQVVLPPLHSAGILRAANAICSASSHSRQDSGSSSNGKQFRAASRGRPFHLQTEQDDQLVLAFGRALARIASFVRVIMKE